MKFVQLILWISNTQYKMFITLVLYDLTNIDSKHVSTIKQSDVIIFQHYKNSHNNFRHVQNFPRDFPTQYSVNSNIQNV